jgi:hypothetical protein
MEEPRIHKMVPVFGIASYKDAVAHYVDWLGFHLDWEWREAPGEPVIMAISRDDVAFMLNEWPGSFAGSNVTLHVRNLEVLAEEWNARRPGSATVEVGPPYEIPTLTVTDPFGNTLSFQGENPVDQVREENGPKMRAYIQKKLDEGEPFPTPEEVREAVGPVLGLAIEVLNEFPGYGEAYRGRKASPSSLS